MKTKFLRAAPYCEDVMNLPVADIEVAIPYYVNRLGFTVDSKQTAPVKRVELKRDDVSIGLAENGGDSTQDGAFFEVSDLEAAFEEIKGEIPVSSSFKVATMGAKRYRAFFEIAPDGLCYMIGVPVP